MVNNECPCCDQPFEVDGDGDPYETDGLCDDCYHEQCEFTCCACQEYGHVNDQHNFCVVFDKEAGVDPGIYRIIYTPYFWSDILSSGLFLHSLLLIASLPFIWPTGRKGYSTGNPIFNELISGESFDGYPMGHLCGDCQKAILEQIGKRER
jgi:hypothetical protein